jgi:branched-chain amino acid:cation transporter, LIVCS family
VTKHIAATTGMALFAMFFGAGNIVYPLALGASAGTQIIYAMIAFLITGVGLPFLGLFATSLYQGDYREFFGQLGRIPAFLVISFLAFILGPLLAIPRTETVTYQTLLPFLSSIHMNNPYMVSGTYCSILFFLTYRHKKIVDIIGKFLSPIKLILFVVLIGTGLTTTHKTLINHQPIFLTIKEGLLDGYGTMDLLCAFFFCTAAYQNVFMKAKANGITEAKIVNKIFLQACFVGGLILSLIYIGFTLIALRHALDLQGINMVQMIQVISRVILGDFGSLFVGICVLFACIATATALTDVTTQFFYESLFNKKINRVICLIGILIITFVMTIVGFSGIMMIALPILEIIYPSLIIYSIMSIIKKKYGEQLIKIGMRILQASTVLKNYE